MPIILDNAWSAEGKWLNVKRILFTSQVGDLTKETLKYKSETGSQDTTVDPGNENARWNNTDESLVTQLAISSTDRDSQSQALVLAAIKIGDEILIAESDNRYFICDVTATPIDMGAWFQIDVTTVFDLSTVRDNKDIDIRVTFFPDAIPRGGEILEISMAQEWPWVVYRLFDPASVVPKERGVIPISDISLIVIE